MPLNAEEVVDLRTKAYTLAQDSDLRNSVQKARSTEEVYTLFLLSLRAKHPELFPPLPKLTGLESQGGVFDAVMDSIKKGLSNTRNGVLRGISSQVLNRKRDDINSVGWKFVGDALVYIQQRGTVENPGPIIQAVLDALRTSRGEGEPLIVITHSMGGNIFYDILTYYAPDLKVDFWVSVGGQVGFFEEMKVFQMSDVNTYAPQKVEDLPNNVGYWLNVYDPVDIFGYKVEPVFAKVNADVSFSTGMPTPTAHSVYFDLVRFYELTVKHLKIAFTLPENGV